MKKIYPTRKSFVKFDDDHFLLYLAEQVIEDYQPEPNTPGSPTPAADDTEPVASGITAYSYEGTEPDGSTKIAAQEATYGAFSAGLVRLKYSQDEVEAILANKGDGNEEHQAEFDDYQSWRTQAKEIATDVLARQI